jgi:hypothetical protein
MYAPNPFTLFTNLNSSNERNSNKNRLPFFGVGDVGVPTTTLAVTTTKTD